MNKWLLFLSFFVSFLWLWPYPALAHILKTDGSIGAVMHTDPDDDPVANSVTGIYFEFKDTQNKLTAGNCDCTFSILESGKEIYSQPLFQNNSTPTLDNSTVFFTFPKEDTYQVKVVGKPNISGNFQSFTLVYNVTVGKNLPEDKIATPSSTTIPPDISSATSSPTHLLTYLGVALGILVALLYLRRR